MKKEPEEQTRYLIKNFSALIKKFKYEKPPGLYFYKKVISKRRNSRLENLLNDKNFIELIYSTLISWGMNSRGARLKYFDDFHKNLRKNRKNLILLSKFKLDSLSEEMVANEIKPILEKLYDNLELMNSKSRYDNLELMNSKSRLVSNSKLLHFILPDLVMPMDRTHTLTFFYGNTGESKNKFLKILECSWYIANSIDLKKYLCYNNNEWHQTIPKIIDNIIFATYEKSN